MKKVLILILALGLVAGISVTIARSDHKRSFKFQYAAKFVCGADPADAFVRVIPGFYSTTIAIHNPQGRRVSLRKKLALTFPPGPQRPGDVSPFQEDTLEADEALQVDCGEIYDTDENNPNRSEFFLNQGFPPYIQGFLIIESKRSLDVSGYYTVGEGALTGEAGSKEFVGSVRSIDMEQIKERVIETRKRRRDDDDDD